MEKQLFAYILNQSTISTSILLQIDPISLSKSILVCKKFYEIIKSKDFWKLKFARPLVNFNFTRMMKYYFFIYFKDDYWSQKYKIGKKKFFYGKECCECIEFKNKKIRKKDRGEKTYYGELSSKINLELVDPGRVELECSNHRRTTNFGQYQLNENSISFYKSGSNQHIEMKVMLGVNERRLLCIDQRGKIYENTWDVTVQNFEIPGIEFAIDLIYCTNQNLYVLYPWGEVIAYSYKYDNYESLIRIDKSKTLDFRCKKFDGRFMITTDDRITFAGYFKKLFPIEIKHSFENIRCISQCVTGGTLTEEFYLYDGTSLYFLAIDMIDSANSTVKKVKNMRDIVSLHTFGTSLIITKNK